MMEEETRYSSDCDQHLIFSSDPAVYMYYLYKEVCILTGDGNTHTGWVYTIDPVSRSVVLATFTSRTKFDDLKVILGHAICNINVINDDTNTFRVELDSLSKPKEAQHDCNLSKEELGQRKKKLQSWLLKNRVPVQESTDSPDVLSISDALFIGPPYGAENCQSTNEIILGKVQGLIKNMPKDVSEW